MTDMCVLFCIYFADFPMMPVFLLLHLFCNYFRLYVMSIFATISGFVDVLIDVETSRLFWESALVLSIVLFCTCSLMMFPEVFLYYYGVGVLGSRFLLRICSGGVKEYSFLVVTYRFLYSGGVIL